MTFPEGCMVAGQNRVQGQCDAMACNYPFCEASGTRNPDIIIVSTDFGEAEARALAWMISEGHAIILESSPTYDLKVAMFADLPEKEAGPSKPPAPYLRHDPTKNVRKRRRGRRE